METLFVFECTIVNLATYRQFTNVEIGLSIKTKKTKKQKHKQNESQKKKKFKNCIKSGLSQFLFLQQKI